MIVEVALLADRISKLPGVAQMRHEQWGGTLDEWMAVTRPEAGRDTSR